MGQTRGMFWLPPVWYKYLGANVLGKSGIGLKFYSSDRSKRLRTFILIIFNFCNSNCYLIETRFVKRMGMGGRLGELAF